MMRRSLVRLLSAAALVVSAPAFAKETRSTLPDRSASSLLSVTSVCDATMTNPDALACSGYFAGNLINGSPTDIANAQDAIELLPGDFVWDGNWAEVDATKIMQLVSGNVLDFGQTLFGLTIIGAHFGNVDGADGNVSVFWLFDFGTAGASSIILDHPEGFSNAAIYTTGAPPVPEPATWAMMLFGFAIAGYALRRNRRPNFAQLA
jgi:hypothetical protein